MSNFEPLPEILRKKYASGWPPFDGIGGSCDCRMRCQLGRLGIQARGSIRTRGTLAATAQRRLIEQNKLNILTRFWNTKILSFAVRLR